MSAMNNALLHAMRECWRANDKALSAAGCLYLALDEVQKLVRETEDQDLVSVAKLITGTQAMAETVARQAETARAHLDDVARKGQQ